MMPLEATDPASVAVPLPRIGSFVRQVTHDIRNSLNSLDLQAAYLQELIADPEAVEEVKQMRAMVHASAKQLQALSSNFWTGSVNLVNYQASVLIEDFQSRLQKLYPNDAAKVNWQVELGDESVPVDIEMFFGALQRIFENAFQFAETGAEIKAHVFTEPGRFVLALAESKSTLASDPSHWGREPFVSTRRGGYGLGLFRAQSFLAAQDGDLQFTHDSGRALLTTRVTLPLAHP